MNKKIEQFFSSYIFVSIHTYFRKKKKFTNSDSIFFLNGKNVFGLFKVFYTQKKNFLIFMLLGSARFSQLSLGINKETFIYWTNKKAKFNTANGKKLNEHKKTSGIFGGKSIKGKTVGLCSCWFETTK